MIGAIIVGVLGILFEVIGYFLWKKQKISLLHSYDHDNVSPENKKVFCKLAGIGVTIIGMSMLLTAVALALSENLWAFLAFMIGFTVGLGLLIHAENKYNR